MEAEAEDGTLVSCAAVAMRIGRDDDVQEATLAVVADIAIALTRQQTFRACPLCGAGDLQSGAPHGQCVHPYACAYSSILLSILSALSLVVQKKI